MSNSESNPQGCPQCGGKMITTTHWIDDDNPIDTENCYCKPTNQEQEFGAYVLNVGRDHYAICAKHNTFRWAGSNLFSNWQEMTDEDFRENAVALLAMKPLTPAEAEWQKRAKKVVGEIPKRGH